MSFRANLQYLRAQRNMPQEQLAMLLGVSRQAISKWESEKAVSRDGQAAYDSATCSVARLMTWYLAM